MADNPTAGGVVVAADDIGGVNYQRIKLIHGADNTNDGDVSTANPLPVGGAAAHDAAVVGPPLIIGGRAQATAPTAVSADGDAVRAWLLLNGAQCVALTAAGALIGGDATNGLDVDVTRLPGIAGVAAHDAAVSGNPVRVAGRARSSDPTAVAADDTSELLLTLLGKLVTQPFALIANAIQGNANFTTTTVADVIAAQAAGVRIVVMSITVINKHATVDTTVSIRDGATVRIGPLMAKAAGGGFTISTGFPLIVGTAATAIRAICGTTGADVDVTITGYTTTE